MTSRESGHSTSARDSQFLSAVEAVLDAATDPAQWPRALAAIADFFEDVGAVLIWGKADGSFGTIASESLTDAQQEYQRSWASRDIRAQRSLERGYFFNGLPFTDRHLVSNEEVQTHVLYTDFLRSFGLGWIGAIGVSPHPDIDVALSVQRDAGKKPPFSDGELGDLLRVGRYVEKSLRLSMRLFDAELINLGFAETLSRVGLAVFVLDMSGEVVFSNPAGGRLLGRGLDLVRGRLIAGSAEDSRKLKSAISRTLSWPESGTGSEGPILVKSASSDRPLVVYLLPVTRSASLRQQLLTRARIIMLVIEPARGEPPDAAVVRDILGLTLGEARIAALVGSGLPLDTAADKLGISKDSARTVLKRVFAKAGVSRQSELVALLTKLVLH